MNAKLQQAIAELGVSEFDAMNLMQQNGIISDLCVSAADIADSDVPTAVKYLKFAFGALI